MFTGMKRPFPVMALVGALALLLAAITTARADAVFETPRVRAELMAEYPAVAPGDSLWVALALEVKADWHTYWRTPGDAGEPTSIPLEPSGGHHCR